MSKRTWIGLAAAAVFATVAVGLAGLAVPMGMGTMDRGGMHGGPGMMGGGMMGGAGWGGSGASGYPPGERDRAGNPQADTPESIARGRTAYQARCVACHGPEGRGDGPAAAGFARRPANLYALAGQRPDGQLFTALTYGWGGMPAFGGTLTEQERWDVVNYVQSLKREGLRSPASP